MNRSFRLALAGLFVLAASAIAGAQGVRYDNTALLDSGRPAQGIGIRVCSSGSTGTPCTPLASIFSDSALSLAITQPGFQSDAQGNYNFYAACNKYDIQLSGNGVTTRTMKDVQLGPCGTFNNAAASTSQVKSLQLGNDTAFTAAPRIMWSCPISSFASTAAFCKMVLDQPITITRGFLNLNASTPAGCTTLAVIQITDGTTPRNLTVANGTVTDDTGAISSNYAAGATLTFAVSTPAAGCTTSPTNGFYTIQYKMQ